MSEGDGRGAYASAGVDIDAQDRALIEIKELARGTATAGVLSSVGGFGGLFDGRFETVEAPVLVASADGVGTKLVVARMAGDFSTVGTDLVNHCANDILVQGARPLFFLDYVGAGVLRPDELVALVGGVAAGCRENGCALLGGETAEMPGFYQEGDYELVGFIVGVADRGRLLGPHRVRAGDRILGLASSGLHTNGYSLARRVIFDQLGLGIHDRLLDVAEAPTVAEALLAIHRTYLPVVGPHLGEPGLHALAHVTGGGLTDNLPRSLPIGLRARVDPSAWSVPPLFHFLQRQGKVSEEEMRRVFNLGIGLALLVDRDWAPMLIAELSAAGEEVFEIGEVEEGDRGVHYGS